MIIVASDALPAPAERVVFDMRTWLEPMGIETTNGLSLARPGARDREQDA
jgi:hypothetical protein